MPKAKSSIPEGFRTLTQYLILDHAIEFQKFIENAFSATERFVMREGDGIIRHAEAQLGESIIEFAEASGQWKAMPAGLHYYVRNSNEVYARALKAGGTSLYEPANRDYGDREAGVQDPSGNFWFIATHTAGNSYKPEILQDLNSYFSVKDSARFLEFLGQAFGAEVLENHTAKDGTIMHAKVRIGDTTFELSEGRAPWGPRAVSHHLYAQNCDEVFARGLANGCKELQPMADQFYGDRSGSLVDAWGNHWYIASHLEDLTPEEIAQRAAAAGRQ
jgi:PhnB protein